MQHFTIDAIKDWDRFYRGNFINSLSGFKPVSLVGTINEAGNPNLAIFSNIVHIGADPALIGFINRPLEAAKHTITNIRETGCYTINHVNETFVARAHQTSAKYPVDEDEFTATGLSTEYHPGCRAPFVMESKIKYALQLAEVIPIQHNGTFLVIGSITDVFLDGQLTGADVFIAIEKAGSIASLGIDGYYTATPIARYEYARKDTTPTKIIT
jgi:flavin reductase (DIM6/NTAB) family NADH-FMN oxidoreductase RutF